VPHPRGGAVSRDVGDWAALAVLRTAWHPARRPAKRARDGSRTMGLRVEVIPAGGGAAAAVERRPEVQRCRRQEAEQGHVREEEEERGEVQGTCLRFPKSSRTSR
jgi:hypothetical protein